MTQHVVVTRKAEALSLPPILTALTLRPEMCSFLPKLFPGYNGPYARIVEVASGEADTLFDALFNKPDRGRGATLMRWLESLAKDGCGIAVWYGADVADLPKFRDWDEFATAVHEDTSRQPPEAYAVLLPAT